jgi:site-specific DNA-methyltransferase (adenine-specific)
MGDEPGVVGASSPFPLELPTRAILVSAEVNKVLDPYCGSGTTLQAASNAGIRSIGIDNDPWAIELTRKRLGQTTEGDDGCIEPA